VNLLFYPAILVMLLLAMAEGDAAESNAVHVALIFDDGPVAEQLPKLLAIFKQENIHVTFGSVAKNVESQANLAKTILAAGHEIANHSYSHRHPKELDDATLEKEIVGAQKIIATSTGFSPKWYWPPFLETEDRVRAAAAKAQIEVYTPHHLVVSEDYRTEVSAEEIKRKATTNVIDGTVILFHEWRKETAEQMPAILAELKRQHCVFDTFSELHAYLDTKKQPPARGVSEPPKEAARGAM
jgi:peptidoglycan/xylan/chitin deacetylase (PgdA/CDA1 family)